MAKQDWYKLSGAADKKVRKLLKSPNNKLYVFNKKILGKSIFLRDHGVMTLYVLGKDDYFYSAKVYYWPGNELFLNRLVYQAISGDLNPKDGFYRNFKAGILDEKPSN